jgi:DNA polymerase elongation subunit (family B)
MPLVIDIETVGQKVEGIPSRAVEILFRSLQRMEGSEEDVEARKQEMIGRFGLDPTTGHIVCIGLLDVERDKEEAFYGTDEKVILQSFWEFLGKARPRLFVTFNGKSFDFPYINIRSAILEIPPTMLLPTRRYSADPHFDVREVLAGDDRHRRGSLEYFCEIFGIASPKGQMDGSQVGEAFEQGRLEEIARYCLADCRATAALYQRLKPYYLPTRRPGKA